MLDNWLAIVVAAATFMVGGLWYGPALFGPVWCKEAYGDPEVLKQKAGHPAKVFGASYVMALVMAAALSHFLGPKPEWAHATATAALMGATLVGTSFGINYAFASRGITLWLVDAGYHVLQFALIGLVLSLLG